VPLGKPMQYVGAAPDDVREAFVFPALETGRASFTLVEDDGVSLGYQRGETSLVTLEVTTTPDAVALAVQVEHAGYPLPYDAVTFLLPPGETRAIEAADAVMQRGADGWLRVQVPVPQA
jgi:alpha-glucosidase